MNCPNCNYPGVTTDGQGPFKGIYTPGKTCGGCNGIYMRSIDAFLAPPRKKEDSLVTAFVRELAEQQDALSLWRSHSPRADGIQRRANLIVLRPNTDFADGWEAGKGEVTPKDVEVRFTNMLVIFVNNEWPEGWLWAYAPPSPKRKEPARAAR
jgi:hypothetical protein